MRGFLKFAGMMAVVGGIALNAEGMNGEEKNQDPNLGSVVLNLVDEIQANFELFKGTEEPRELYKIRLNENKLDKDGCPELEYLDSEIDDADIVAD